MTTIEANTIMKEELNFKGSMMKKKKDIISAIVILEQYLNSCKKK
jgi:RNase H-fold protein (predicted Holliday junction resolvase)